MNLTHIHTDHCAKDISLLEFKQFCHRVWGEEHNFVTIDLTSTLNEWKVSSEFQLILFPNWYYIKQHGSIQIRHHGSV